MNSLINKAFWALLFLLGLASCTTASADNFTVNLDLKGVPDSIVAILRPVSHVKDTPLVGKGVVIDGKATIIGSVDAPTPVYFMLSNGTGVLPMFIENRDITVSGTLSYTTDKKDPARFHYNFKGLHVSGSEHTGKFQQIYAVKDSLSNVLFSTRREIEGMKKSLEEAKAANNTAKVREIENSELYGKAQVFEHEFIETIDSVYTDMIHRHSDSFWGPVIMMTYYVYYVPEMRSLYDGMSEEAKATKYGREIKKELYPLGVIGDKLPEFISYNADGNSIKMKDLAEKNKLLLIDFWASWCKPCRREIPNLKKIYEKYHDQGFDILSISIDENDEAWRKALEKEKMPWTNCRDTEKDISKLYGVQSIPMLVVVDNAGKMVIENLRGEELSERIGQLLAE